MNVENQKGNMCRIKNAKSIRNAPDKIQTAPKVSRSVTAPKQSQCPIASKSVSRSQTVLKQSHPLVASKQIPSQKIILIDSYINRTVMEWLIQIFNHIELEDIKYIDNRIIFLAKNLLLKYNEKKQGLINETNAQLIGSCALILAYKYELDNDHMPSDLISAIMKTSDGAYNLEQYLAVERDMFITLCNNFYIKIEYDIMIEKIYKILDSKMDYKTSSARSEDRDLRSCGVPSNSSAVSQDQKSLLASYINPLCLKDDKLYHKNLLYSLSIYFLERLIYYNNEKISEECIDTCIILSIYIIQKLDIYGIVSRIFTLKNKGILKVYKTIHNFSLSGKTDKKDLNCIKKYIENYDVINSKVIKVKYHDKITKMLCKHFVNSDTFLELFK